MSGSAIDPIGPLPAGVKPPKTAQEHALYDACKNFEAMFVQHIVTDMLSSARGDDDATGAQGVYQDMADQTMTQSLVDSGSFGLAGTVYGQLVQTMKKTAAAS
jgi:Rod binding domain-containing protein